MRRKFERAMKKIWLGKCDIYEYESNTKGIVHTELKKVYEGIPCRLSFEQERERESRNTYAQSNKEQYAKLILSNEPMIKAGSVIDVEQNNVKKRYKSSGEPSIYSSHQEIMLEIYKEWC